MPGTLIHLGEEQFDDLASEVSYCVANLRDPRCVLPVAGRFYEKAAEALRAHAILRLLVDADGEGFSNDLVMSGQARRAFLRRCARNEYADYYLALSRSGSMLDAMAGDDFALAGEILTLSPRDFRQGDEYQEDFHWQRLLGLLAAGAPPTMGDAAISLLAAATEDSGARLAVARALYARQPAPF